MAGTPQKMLEYILETRIDAFAEDEPIDVFLEDFILTHIIYLPINLLCRYLKDYYIRKSYLPPRSDFRGLHPVEADIDIEQRVISKRRVVTFLGAWQLVMKNRLFLNKVANSFIEEINSCVLEDSQNLPNMQPILIKINKIRNIKENGMKRLHRKPLTVLAVGGIYTSEAPAPQPILPIDMCNQVFYSSDLTYITLSVCLEKSAYDIVQMVKPKFRFQDDQEQKFLVQVKSNGERVIFGQNEISISTMLPQNSRLYIVNKEEVENLSPTIDQTLNNWDNTGYVSLLERLRCSEIATQLTQFHNQLFEATEEIELVIQVLGKNLFPDQTCSNLDLLMRRFNEIQFWCTTEILMARGCAKRTETLKKFIKIANYCKDSNDLLSLFAITLSLSSAPISRLNSLWKSVPQKFIRQYNEFESLLDPSRNHRSYRMFIAKLSPPIIPFIPLILKDLTFINEGNKTYFTGLVNFEKMHMIADGLRTFRNCKASSLGYITAIKKPEIMYLVKNFLVIDNSKKLMELSYQIERPRRIVKDY
uniref:Ras-GEF domain-containing protein n=1 Tax=Rhabditophanes sp. KR3021 TaxID=114890 RepID=A0AC35U356_9BILA